jgi:hypothetical protein
MHKDDKLTYKVQCELAIQEQQEIRRKELCANMPVQGVLSEEVPVPKLEPSQQMFDVLRSQVQELLTDISSADDDNYVLAV